MFIVYYSFVPYIIYIFNYHSMLFKNIEKKYVYKKLFLMLFEKWGILSNLREFDVDKIYIW